MSTDAIGDDTSRSSDSDSSFDKERNPSSIAEPDEEFDKLVISVIDSGIGIKKKDKLKLFKLFGTLQNTRQMNTQGIGLGLVISENIVKAFSGNIGVKSIYGKGTQFTFSMLLGKSDLTENQVVADNNKR